MYVTKELRHVDDVDGPRQDDTEEHHARLNPVDSGRPDHRAGQQRDRDGDQNVAVTEVQPENRAVARYQYLKCTVRLYACGDTDAGPVEMVQVVGPGERQRCHG